MYKNEEKNPFHYTFNGTISSEQSVPRRLKERRVRTCIRVLIAHERVNIALSPMKFVTAVVLINEKKKKKGKKAEDESHGDSYRRSCSSFASCFSRGRLPLRGRHVAVVSRATPSQGLHPSDGKKRRDAEEGTRVRNG